MGDFRVPKRRFKRGIPEDRISLLPVNILTRILSFLTFKEAGRTSVLSKRWKNAWTELDFDALPALRAMAARGEVYSVGLKRERSKFINWVNNVLESHQALELSRFRIYMDMDNSFEEYLDEWIEYAFDRNVQRLELNLSRHGSGGFLGYYDFPYYQINHRSWNSLKVMILRSVNIAGIHLQYFTWRCRFLETLVVHDSEGLTSLEVHGPSIALQHLEILYCPLKSLIISNATNLVSLKIEKSDAVVVKNVPKLVDLQFFGCPYNLREVIQDRFSCCFSKLESLSLDLVPLRVEEFERSLPQLSALKHLSISLSLPARKNNEKKRFPDLAFFFKAAPDLEKFVIRLEYPAAAEVIESRRQYWENVVANNNVRHLKVVEIQGYRGCTIELELAKYFLKNAVSLEKLIVDPRYQYMLRVGEPWLDGPDIRGLEDAITSDGRRCAEEQLPGLIPSHVTLQIL